MQAAQLSEHLVAAAHDQVLDTEQALMLRTQSDKYEQPEELQQLHALAGMTSPEPDKVFGLCLWTLFLPCILTHTMPCVQTTLPLTQPLGNTDVVNQMNLHNQTSALAHQQSTGNLQEQGSALQDEKV